ncbi:nucleolar protein 12-domain-containing protein [Kalaharituber pfeilii]|nr:nucleolar protein 12-domain-containing protein [Kalaharituber pfeilii]
MPPSKKRKRSAKVIEFDKAARQDYLTGFHKRKVQRTKKAQEEALRKAREERIKERKELRDNRKKELEEHVKAIEAALKPPGDLGDDTEEDEVEEPESETPPTACEPIRQDEYVDEEKFTTVTVEPISFESSDDEEVIDKSGRWKSTEKEDKKPKKPKEIKKKFTYLSKAERRDMNRKIKATKMRRATEGKEARKNKSGHVKGKSRRK